MRVLVRRLCLAATAGLAILFCHHESGPVVPEPPEPGELLWRYEHVHGLDYTPAVSPGRTICFGAGNDFRAVSDSGDLVWHYNVVGWPWDKVSTAPAIGPDGTIYFGTTAQHIAALNPNGTEKWTFVPGEDVTSAPAVSRDGVIYFGVKGKDFCALNPDATEKWRYDIESVTSPAAVGTDGRIFVGDRDGWLYSFWPGNGVPYGRVRIGTDIESGPALGWDGRIYCGSDDGCLYAVNPDLSIAWKYATGGPVVGSPAVTLDAVYFGSTDGYLYCLNSDSTLRWRYATGGAILGSPAVGTGGVVWFGSCDGSVYSLDSSGTLRWRYATGDSVKSSPAIGPRGTVYIGSSDSYLYAIHDTCCLASAPWPKFHHDPSNTGQSSK